MSSSSLEAVSLFSGAGGLDIGLERAGFDVTIATDIDRRAIESLEGSKATGIPVPDRLGHVHLGGTRIVRADVCELGASDLRPPSSPASWRPALLAGGPPCQPWSSAGLQRGFRDSRGMLIAQMIRLTDELRPGFVLMENVRGLLTAVGADGHHGEAIEVIQREWENLGYAVTWSLLNAADFGAAQRRVRLVMLATAEHQVPAFPLPTHDRAGKGGNPWVSLGEFLTRFGPPEEGDDVALPSGDRAKELMELAEGQGLRSGGRVEHQRPGGHWGYRQDSFVADLTLPSRTIRAAATPDWVRIEGQPMRRLTWRECAALQGFPDKWVFAGSRSDRFRLIGNAVQTDMATAVAVSVRRAIEAGTPALPPISPDWPEYFVRRIRGAASDHRANAASRVRHVPLARAS